MDSSHHACRFCGADATGGTRFVAFKREAYACERCAAVIRTGGSLAKKGAVSAARRYLSSRFPNFFEVMQLYVNVRNGNKT